MSVNLQVTQPPQSIQQRPPISIEDYRRALLDWVKQLTALSTGSIVIVVGFIQKEFEDAAWKELIGLSLISFAVSVFGALMLPISLLRLFQRDSWTMRCMAFITYTTAIFGFFGGLVFLTLFALRNTGFLP